MFLLMFNINYEFILHQLRATATYELEVADFRSHFV